jgi:antitoxin ParD1/3/4
MAQFHITLSDDALAFIRSKMTSGEYASESDVINESLEILKTETEERERWEGEALKPTNDAELERWLKEVGGPRYDDFHANPSSGIPVEQVEKYLEERRQQRAKARS